MAKLGYKNDIKILGISVKIVEHGTPNELHKECGYDAQSLINVVRKIMKKNTSEDYRVNQIDL